MGRKIYSAYVAIITVFFYLITFPIQLIILQFKSLKKYGHFINKFVIKCIQLFCYLKINFKNKNAIKNDSSYIFCSNHSSFIDIPFTFLLQKRYIKFVGKISLEKIPLFGYMYKRLYITVDRRDKESRSSVYDKCSKAIDEGCSICIYPEGAISSITPKLIPFKDGAFKLSVEKKIPIVPVTFPYNYLILPVDSYIINNKKALGIIHEPLNTPENPINDYKVLKQMTFDIINNELKKHNVI